MVSRVFACARIIHGKAVEQPLTSTQKASISLCRAESTELHRTAGGTAGGAGRRLGVEEARSVQWQTLRINTCNQDRRKDGPPIITKEQKTIHDILVGNHHISCNAPLTCFRCMMIGRGMKLAPHHASTVVAAAVTGWLDPPSPAALAAAPGASRREGSPPPGSQGCWSSCCSLGGRIAAEADVSGSGREMRPTLPPSPATRAPSLAAAALAAGSARCVEDLPSKCPAALPALCSDSPSLVSLIPPPAATVDTGPSPFTAVLSAASGPALLVACTRE